MSREAAKGVIVISTIGAFGFGIWIMNAGAAMFIWSVFILAGSYISRQEEK